MNKFERFLENNPVTIDQYKVFRVKDRKRKTPYGVVLLSLGSSVVERSLREAKLARLISRRGDTVVDLDNIITVKPAEAVLANATHLFTGLTFPGLERVKIVYFKVEKRGEQIVSMRAKSEESSVRGIFP